MLEYVLNPLNQIAFSFIGAYLFENRKQLIIKLKSIPKWSPSEKLKKQARPFSELLQFGLLISIVCFVFLQIGLTMLTGTSAILNGVPLNYVFVVKGLSVLCTFVGSFFILRLIHLGEDSIFKKYLKFS